MKQVIYHILDNIQSEDSFARRFGRVSVNRRRESTRS